MRLSDQQALAKLGITVDVKSFNQDVDELYIQAMAKLEEAIVHVESNANHYKDLGEEALSAIVAGQVSSGMIFTTKTEPNVRGHVDFYIYAPSLVNDSVFQILGEAKIWKGNVYETGGFDQIMKYSSGRFKNSFFITYFTIAGCDLKIKEFLDYLIKNRGGQITSTVPRKMKSEHEHSSGSKAEITHLIVNLHI